MSFKSVVVIVGCGGREAFYDLLIKSHSFSGPVSQRYGFHMCFCVSSRDMVFCFALCCVLFHLVFALVSAVLLGSVAPFYFHKALSSIDYVFLSLRLKRKTERLKRALGRSRIPFSQVE